MPDFVARYIGLAVFLVFAVMFKFIVTRSGTSDREKREQFMQDEREANFSRVREIPEDVYYHPDTSKLPVKEYPDQSARVALMQSRALKAAEKPMLRLDPPMSNIDIKRAFGATSLDMITTREEYYEQYIRALANWATELIGLENYDDAETVLNVCVDMSALFFLPYSLLCDVYAQKGDREALHALKDKIDNRDIIKDNDMLFRKISDYIKLKLNE